MHEVFITDMIVVDERTCLVGAQLPMSHAYFLDSSDNTPRYRSALLAECCRQACTYVAHVRYEAPVDWVFLVTELSLELPAAARLRVGEVPSELVIIANTDADTSGGRLRALRCSFEICLDGEPVGRMGGVGRYVTAEEYQMLRSAGRVGPTPTSSGLERTGTPVAPGLVGRTDPRDVVLADARRTDAGAEALLSVSGRHPTIFDHPLDHFPGMALVEAAAQAASLTLELSGTPGAGAVPVGVRATFARFAEIDAPVEVSTRLMPAVPGSDGVVHPVAVTLRQSGAEIATLEVDALIPGPDHTEHTERAEQTERTEHAEQTEHTDSELAEAAR